MKYVSKLATDFIALKFTGYTEEIVDLTLLLKITLPTNLDLQNNKNKTKNSIKLCSTLLSWFMLAFKIHLGSWVKQNVQLQPDELVVILDRWAPSLC